MHSRNNFWKYHANGLKKITSQQQPDSVILKPRHYSAMNQSPECCPQNSGKQKDQELKYMHHSLQEVI